MTKEMVYSLKRPLLIVTAALMMAVTSASNFMFAQVSAEQVSSRYIKMSSSAPSATGVSYSVKFVAGSAHTPQKFIVDFCSNSPLVGTSCTAPTGFSVSASPTFTNNPDALGANVFSVASGWTASSLNTNRTFVLTNAANATALATSGTNSIVNFSINTVTNPSTTCATQTACAFYARVITYTSSATAYTAGTEGAFTDQGGFALSTATAIALTARVMETLSFCVYTTTCGDATDVELGTGTPKALSIASIDTANMNFALSTNALNGAIVRLKGDTLKAGSNDIDPMGATATTMTASSTTERFGIRIASAGGMTATAPYNGAAGAYGLDVTTGAENLTTTYGDTFATATAPVNSSVTQFTYAATAANTTPAGIYTATHQFIATGTF